MKDTKVISAFPGMGKSTMYRKYKDSGFKITDSDSSTFDKKNFPANYIEHIKDCIGKYDVVFVSSHKEVRDAMWDAGILYTVIYPDISRKDEFLKNYKERGNNENFIKLLDENWESWINQIENDEPRKIKLEEGKFIGDVVELK